MVLSDYRTILLVEAFQSKHSHVGYLASSYQPLVIYTMFNFSTSEYLGTAQTPMATLHSTVTL